MRDYLKDQCQALLTRHLPEVFGRDPGGEVNYDRCDPILNDLVKLFREACSCEHRVAPCSGLHDEGERILICNTELTELQLDRAEHRQRLKQATHDRPTEELPLCPPHRPRTHR